MINILEIIGKRSRFSAEALPFHFCRRYSFCLPLAYVLSFLLGYEREYLQNDVGYQRTDEILVAARVEKRHIENQNVHFFSRVRMRHCSCISS